MVRVDSVEIADWTAPDRFAARRVHEAVRAAMAARGGEPTRLEVISEPDALLGPLLVEVGEPYEVTLTVTGLGRSQPGQIGQGEPRWWAARVPGRDDVLLLEAGHGTARAFVELGPSRLGRTYDLDLHDGGRAGVVSAVKRLGLDPWAIRLLIRPEATAADVFRLIGEGGDRIAARGGLPLQVELAKNELDHSVGDALTPRRVWELRAALQLEHQVSTWRLAPLSAHGSAWEDAARVCVDRAERERAGRREAVGGLMSPLAGVIDLELEDGHVRLAERGLLDATLLACLETREVKAREHRVRLRLAPFGVATDGELAAWTRALEALDPAVARGAAVRLLETSWRDRHEGREERAIALEALARGEVAELAPLLPLVPEDVEVLAVRAPAAPVGQREQVEAKVLAPPIQEAVLPRGSGGSVRGSSEAPVRPSRRYNHPDDGSPGGPTLAREQARQPIP